MSQDSVHNNIADIRHIEQLTSLDYSLFLSDPQGFNSYAYGRNNSIVYNDPTGNRYYEQYNPLEILYRNSVNKIVNGLYYGNYKQYGQGLLETAITTNFVIDTGLTVGMSAGALYSYRQNLVVKTSSIQDDTADLTNQDRQLANRGPQNLKYTTHAKDQMLRRNVSTSQVEETVRNADPFDYYHDGNVKTGYRDPSTKIFVATPKTESKVITVITNTNSNYQNNLVVKSQPSYSENVTVTVKR